MSLGAVYSFSGKSAWTGRSQHAVFHWSIGQVFTCNIDGADVPQCLLTPDVAASVCVRGRKQ